MSQAIVEKEIKKINKVVLNSSKVHATQMNSVKTGRWHSPNLHDNGISPPPFPNGLLALWVTSNCLYEEFPPKKKLPERG